VRGVAGRTKVWCCTSPARFSHYKPITNRPVIYTKSPASALNERNVIRPESFPSTTMLPRTAATPGRRSGGIQRIFVTAHDTHWPVSSREYKKFARSCSADDAFDGRTPVVTCSEPTLRRKPSGVKDISSIAGASRPCRQ